MENHKTALWVDDIRPAPAGYYWAKSVHEAKIYCCQHLSPGHILKIDEFNLDYDAGDYGPPDYIELLKWLEKKQHCENWSINGVFKLHSQKPDNSYKNCYDCISSAFFREKIPKH